MRHLHLVIWQMVLFKYTMSHLDVLLKDTRSVIILATNQTLFVNYSIALKLQMFEYYDNVWILTE